MRGVEMFAVLVVVAGVNTQTRAMQSGGAPGQEVSGSAGLELSHEVKPFPRPPIIVNATPPASQQTAPPQKNVASREAQPTGVAACLSKHPQNGAQACREPRKIQVPSPAS